MEERKVRGGHRPKPKARGVVGGMHQEDDQQNTHAKLKNLPNRTRATTSSPMSLVIVAGVNNVPTRVEDRTAKHLEHTERK